MSTVIKKCKRKTESYLGSTKENQKSSWKSNMNDNWKNKLKNDWHKNLSNEIDFIHLLDTTRMEEFTERKEAEPFFEALIKLLGIAFRRERNQNNQAPTYRLILLKLFSHDIKLLEKAAKELGFWFKNTGNGKALLSWSLSKADIEKYKAE